MCYFNICLMGTNTKGRNILQKQWADYFFANLDGNNDEEIIVRGLAVVSVVARRMEASKHVDIVLTEDQPPYHTGDLFKSYQYQALTPISRHVAFASFLALLLKRCVTPSHPRDSISCFVLLPATQLAFERELGLLPAMVCSI